MQFRTSTGESFNYMMYDMATSQPGCDPNPAWNANPPTGCGIGGGAELYMLSFTMLVSFIMMNLFVAVIISTHFPHARPQVWVCRDLVPLRAGGFSEVTAEETVKLSREQLDQFSHCWAEIDPDAHMFVPVSKLYELFQVLQEPLGFGFMYHASRVELDMLIGESPRAAPPSVHGYCKWVPIVRLRVCF